MRTTTRTTTGINVTSTRLMVALLLAAGCAAGNSGTPAGATGGAGAAVGGAGSGPGGSAGGGAGGAVTGENDAAATDGSGAGSGGAMGVPCEVRSALTLAIDIVVSVSWNGSLGASAGTGTFHLWTLAKMTANGTALTGTIQLCGNTLPELMLTPLVGGGTVAVEIPQAVWDSPSAPKFSTTGTLEGWNPGSTLTTAPTIALIGLTMPDPQAAWPASYTMVTSVDTDMDGNPGITGIPKTGAGYVQTPVATPILGIGARADKLYLASRTGVALNGKMTSCTEQSGSAAISFFDSHVLGCHVSGGTECTAAQVDFVDTNQTKYTMMSGTFTSKILPDTATCADARAL
jgi:hypothetical protein